MMAVTILRPSEKNLNGPEAEAHGFTVRSHEYQ